MNDLDVVAELAPQSFAVALGELDDGQRARPASEHAGGGAEPRANLENPIAQIDLRETPREQLVLRGACPPAGRADQGMCEVHR